MSESNHRGQGESGGKPGRLLYISLGVFGAIVALGLLRQVAQRPVVHDDVPSPKISVDRPAIRPHESPESPDSPRVTAHRPTATVVEPDSPTEMKIPAPPRGKLPGPTDYVYVEELPEAITRVAPEYPQVAREAGMEGSVIVRALVDVDGRVVDALVAQGDIPVLDEAAVASVRKWTFKPARAGGAPVAVWVSVPVRFSLH